MSEITISGIKPSDVIGGVMFAVGVAVLLGEVPGLESPAVAILLMVLGIGAVFGSGTFVELVEKLLLSNDEKDGSSDDESQEGESDDGEVGIGRPPGEELEPET